MFRNVPKYSLQTFNAWEDNIPGSSRTVGGPCSWKQEVFFSLPVRPSTFSLLCSSSRLSSPSSWLWGVWRGAMRGRDSSEKGRGWSRRGRCWNWPMVLLTNQRKDQVEVFPHQQTERFQGSQPPEGWRYREIIFKIKTKPVLSTHEPFLLHST